jgi:RNA polymerase sigma factor (sigma-70 family)
LTAGAFAPRVPLVAGTGRAAASRRADWLPVTPAPRIQQADASAAPTDGALMERFCRGDEAAFEMLYERHAPSVFGFLQRMMREPALAEDVLQTTFLSVVRARGRYEPDSSVRAWIFAIAANAGRDALRRRRARREDPVPATASREPAAETPEPPDPAASRAVQDALMQLPLEQREAVVMHKLHDLSFAEIATALGITIGAAKVRAHRGYTRLRELLAPLGESI